MTILLVEDNDEDADVIRCLVSDEFGVSTDILRIKSIEDIFLPLMAKRFDCVLLDINLPGRSGIDFLNTFDVRCCPPIIAITGHQSKAWESRALKFGAAEYISKDSMFDGSLAKAISKVVGANVPLGELTANERREFILRSVLTDNNCIVTTREPQAGSLIDLFPMPLLMLKRDTRAIVYRNNAMAKIDKQSEVKHADDLGETFNSLSARICKIGIGIEIKHVEIKIGQNPPQTWDLVLEPSWSASGEVGGLFAVFEKPASSNASELVSDRD